MRDTFTDRADASPKEVATMVTRTRSTEQPVAFTVIDRGAIWARLALTINQVSELTGLSRRQLSHWVSKGYLVPSSTDPVLFNGNTVEQALYIKQALDAGLSVRRALAAANHFMAEQLQNEPGVKLIRTPLVVDLEAKVRSAYNALAIVLDVLGPAADEHMEAQRRAASESN